MTHTSERNENNALDSIQFILLSALFFLLPLVFWPSSNDFFKLPKSVFFQTLSFSALSLCLLNAFFQKTRFSVFSRARPVLLLFLVYVAACLFSFVFAQSVTVALKDFIPVVSAFALFAALSAQNAPALRRLSATAFFSVLAASAIGILQHFGHDITGISRLSGVPSSFMASTLGHRNYLAELVCMTLPLGFLYAATDGALTSNKRYIVLCALPLMFAALLLTNSRSGLFAVAVSTLFFCSSRGKILVR